MTKLIKKFSLGLAACLTCAFMTTSCNDNNDESIVIFYDIATLTESNSNGFVFTFRQINDSELVTLTSSQKINGDVTVGNRYLIAYTTESGNPYESGPATFYTGLGYVYNGAISYGTAETTGSWATMQQNLQSMWRSGEWINIQTFATCGENDPAKYELVVDSTTLSSDYPKAYLIYEPDKSAIASTRQFYASFNISEVWDLENVKGLSITFMGTNGTQTQDFPKIPNP